MKQPTDYFSRQAQDYAAARPTYPLALHDWLRGLSAHHDCLIDLACGSGQASEGLAASFSVALGLDLSEAQLRQAPPSGAIHTIAAVTEALPLKAGIADLVIVAQAWHWFDALAVEAEIATVLKPGGHLVIWGYNLLRINPAIDALIGRFYHQDLAAHWPTERRILEAGYPDFPRLLSAIETPTFAMSAQWPLARLLQYLRSWSATQQLLAQGGEAVFLQLCDDLSATWQNEPTRLIEWPLILKAARKA